MTIRIRHPKDPYALKVLSYFDANPDEELSNDDIEAKFGPTGDSRSIYKHLVPVVKSGLLETRHEGRYLIYSASLLKPRKSYKAPVFKPLVVDPITSAPATTPAPVPVPVLAPVPQTAQIERDPQGLSPHSPGAKLDAGKTLPALVLLDFAHALNAVAEVGTAGAIKYSESGWLQVKDGKKRYENAMMRHWLQKGMGEHVDLGSGQLHQAHIAWNALAVLELMLREPASGHQSIITQAVRERMESAQ